MKKLQTFDFFISYVFVKKNNFPFFLFFEIKFQIEQVWIRFFKKRIFFVWYTVKKLLKLHFSSAFLHTLSEYLLHFLEK